MKQRVFAWIMSVIMLLGLLPGTAFAAGGGKIHTVSDGADLREFFQKENIQDGDTLQLSGKAFVNDVTDPNDSKPWVIDKAVTIRGGWIQMRAKGILLGADVTFDGVQFGFENRIRNAIMANGYTLTLKDVTRTQNITGQSSARQVHLFCGGLTGPSAVSGAPSGTHGKIMIQGSTSLGNVYAGSLASLDSQNQAQPNIFDNPATIIIDSSATGKMGKVYACGAIQTWVPDLTINPGEFEPNPPTADAGKYRASDEVNISLYDNVVSTVDGETGGSTNANVIYTGGEYLNSNLNVSNIAHLTVQAGKLQPNGDIANANVTVASGAELSLVSFGDAVATGNFTGGGTVVLGQSQTWSIDGAVSGTAQIGIGGILNNASQKPPQTGHTYISAVQSNENSFTLIPHSAQPNYKLVRDTSGNWAVQDGPKQETKVESASFQTPQPLDPNNHGAEIQVDVNYKPAADGGILSGIPMDLKVDGDSASRQEDAETGYSYTTTGNLAQLEFADYGDYEALSILGTGQGEEFDRIAPGQYIIECTIPAKFTVSGQPITFSTTLEVTGGDTGDTDLSKADVKVNGTYVYTGQPILPEVTVTLNGSTLKKDTDYTVTASDNTDAGSATVTVTAANGSSYTGAKSVPFTIMPAPLTVKNAAIADKTYDGGTSAVVQSVTFDNTQTTLNINRDYTVSGEFDDPNAGDNKSVTVTVSLMGKAAQNYALQNNVFHLTGQTIRKGTGTPKSGSMLVTNGLQAVYSYDLPQLLPALPDGQDFGRVTYTLGKVALGSYYTNGAAVQDGVLTLPIQAVSGQEGPVGTVTIQIATDNFTLSDAVIQVSAGNRQSPQGEPTLTPSRLTYGQPLSAIALSGNMKDLGGKTVTGRFTWDAPDTLFGAGSHNALWTFTPDDSAAYVAVTGSAEIVVDRAVPTGRPTYQTMTAAGKTLADAKLTAAFSVPGTVRWKLPDTTPVAANTAYEWVFTPDDAQNYESLSGDIVLWTASAPLPPSGGGSSSGGSDDSDDSDDSSSTTTGTTGNSDGSTTTTVTNQTTGTVTETTKFPDGSKEVVETKKDGTVTTTTTDTAGNKTEVVEHTDGSSKITVDNKDGSGSVTEVDDRGQVVSETTLSQSAVETAQKKGEAVALPMPEVPVTTDRESAPIVTVNLPGGAAAKVEIPVANVTPGTVAVIVKADGTEEVIKTSLTTENGVAVTLSDGYTMKIVDNSKDFDDVADHYWGAEAVAFASSRELFAGTSATTFAPDMAMNRAMFVTVLARFAGVDTTTGSTWYEAGQQWAMENGISDGANMEQDLSREQLATMLWRYAGSPSASAGMSGYTDAGTVSSYAQQAMAWCVEQGIIGGITTATLSPQGPATRAQSAAMLMRFCARYAEPTVS